MKYLYAIVKEAMRNKVQHMSCHGSKITVEEWHKPDLQGLYTRGSYRTKGSALGLAILILILVALGLSGCTGTAPEISKQRPDLVVSAKPRLAAQTFKAARIPQLVAGNTELAFDLYRQLYDGEANLVFAPQNLSTGLAMAYAGAQGDTQAQMAKTLYFEMPDSQLHPAFSTLDQEITSRAPAQYISANALWGSQEDGYLAPFLDTLAEHYGTGVWNMDLEYLEKSRQTINQWVYAETGGRIPELLPPGSLQENPELVLTNAASFEAGWNQAFDAGNTRDATFTRLDGMQVNGPMMNGTFKLPYAQVCEVTAVEIPYEGGTTSLLILLPNSGSFESTAAELDIHMIDTVLETLSPAQVQVSLPKFQFSSGVQMKDTLMALGMVDAFGEADFSGIDGSRELFLDEVYHQANFKVDESGTETAAGSAVVVSRKGDLVSEAVFKADHPFIFMVRDLDSGAVLFLGHLVNPEF